MTKFRVTIDDGEGKSNFWFWGQFLSTQVGLYLQTIVRRYLK